MRTSYGWPSIPSTEIQAAVIAVIAVELEQDATLAEWLQQNEGNDYANEGSLGPFQPSRIRSALC
jgi:hypothetical protein